MNSGTFKCLEVKFCHMDMMVMDHGRIDLQLKIQYGLDNQFPVYTYPD